MIMACHVPISRCHNEKRHAKPQLLFNEICYNSRFKKNNEILGILSMWHTFFDSSKMTAQEFLPNSSLWHVTCPFQDITMKKDMQSYNYCLMKYVTIVEQKKTMKYWGFYQCNTHVLTPPKWLRKNSCLICHYGISHAHFKILQWKKICKVTNTV